MGSRPMPRRPEQSQHGVPCSAVQPRGLDLHVKSRVAGQPEIAHHCGHRASKRGYRPDRQDLANHTAVAFLGKTPLGTPLPGTRDREAQ
jgi:hypothetical protein